MEAKTGDGPLVSVVVPALNRRRYLKATVDSILGQRYPRVECIVVDGGSTDGSVELLRGYGDRIDWVSEPDRGHAHAINKGWRRANGGILAWLNADDRYADPGAVEAGVEALEGHPEADVVYGDYRVVDPSGEVLEDRRRPADWDLERAVRECDHVVPQPTTLIRRRAVRRVGGLDETLGNNKDHDLWLRIGLEGSFVRIPRLTAVVRAGEGLSQRADMPETKVRVVRKFLDRDDLPEQFRSPAFRRRAMSNAYLVAALYARSTPLGWTGVLGYLAEAFRADPSNWGRLLARLAGYGLRLAKRALPGRGPN